MTYEYVCTACHHAWEAEQSISEAPLKDCPSCHAATAKRQVSGGAGFILRGGGWYADGYGSTKKSSSSSESGSSSSSDGGSSSSGGSSGSGTKADSAKSVTV